MLKIGITSCFLYPDMNRAFFGPKTLCYLENDMANYIAKSGILPVLIPDLSQDLLPALLDELDGFILQGGSDVAPLSYGEEPILHGKWMGDPYRDAYELKILDYAVKSKKPVFGICRGLQLMNVYFGGTLYQDIATQLPHAILHRNAQLYDKLHHAIKFAKGKWLDQKFPALQSAIVNSVHHQCINALGHDLEVLATCTDDGIIEAIGWLGDEPGKYMAVQWHPEFSHSLKGKVIDDSDLLKIFLDHVTISKNENN